MGGFFFSIYDPYTTAESMAESTAESTAEFACHKKFDLRRICLEKSRYPTHTKAYRMNNNNLDAHHPLYIDASLNFHPSPTFKSFVKRVVSAYYAMGDVRQLPCALPADRRIVERSVWFAYRAPP